MSFTVQGPRDSAASSRFLSPALGQPTSLSLVASYEGVDVTGSQGLRDSGYQWSDHGSCLLGVWGRVPARVPFYPT